MDRLFIAIKFNKEIEKELISVLHEMKKRGIKGNYTQISNLHMTLCFIGNSDRAAEIKKAISGVKFKPFNIHLAGFGNFGDLIFADLKGSSKLPELVSNTRKVLDELDVEYDKKPFKPHITLIRKASGGKYKDISMKSVEMKVDKILLMKSEHKNGKLVYTEI